MEFAVSVTISINQLSEDDADARLARCQLHRAFELSKSSYRQMYHLEQLKAQGIEVERFKASQPEFTTDPIPPDLLANGLSQYLSPIPVFGYPDKHFAIDRLVPHFELTVDIINGYLEFIRRHLESLGAKEKKLVSDSKRFLKPSQTTKNALNVKPWRRRVCLTVKETQIKLKRVRLLQQGFLEAREIMERIKNLALEFCEHPRMYSFEITRIVSHVKTVQHDMVYRYDMKLIGLKHALTENTLVMTNQMKLFPDKETAVQNLLGILRGALRMTDPLTRCVRECDEHMLFSVFTKSKDSPLRDYEITNMTELTDMIEAAVNALKKFANLEDPELIFVMTSMVMRQFISASRECDNYMKKIDNRLLAFLQAAKNMQLSELNPPRCLNAIIDTKMSVGEWCANDVSVQSSLPLLSPCKFYVDPSDIAYQFNLVHLVLAGKLAEKLKLPLDHKKVSEGVEFMWKLTIISQEDPFIDGIIAFVEKWSKFKLSPKELYKQCVHPINALKSLTKTMK